MSRVLALLKRKDQSSQVIEQIEKYIAENMIKSLRVLEALERELETHSKNPSTPIPVSIWEIAQYKSIKNIKEGVISGEKKYAIWRGILLRYLQLHQLLAVHFADFKGGSSSNTQQIFANCKKSLQNIATWENAPSADIPNASAVERTNEILQKMLAQPSE